MPHSLSLAWRLGQAVAAARSAKQDTAAAVAKAGGGRVLFTGGPGLLAWSKVKGWVAPALALQHKS